MAWNHLIVKRNPWDTRMMSLTQFGELFTVPYFFHKIVETDRLPFWAAISVLNVPRGRTLGFIAVWVGGKTVHRILSRFDTRSQAKYIWNQDGCSRNLYRNWNGKGNRNRNRNRKEKHTTRNIGSNYAGSAIYRVTSSSWVRVVFELSLS